MVDCKTCEYENMCEMPDFVRNNLKLCKTHTPKVKKTNADRIRSMTCEELVEFLENEKIRDEHSLCSDFGNGCYYSCKKNHACHDNIKQLYIEWLQSEAE